MHEYRNGMNIVKSMSWDQHYAAYSHEDKLDLAAIETALESCHNTHKLELHIKFTEKSKSHDLNDF